MLFSHRYCLFSVICSVEMQHAKKLEVVDPKFPEQLQADRQYKQIQKPAVALAKTSLSLDIGRNQVLHERKRRHKDSSCREI